MFLSFGTASFSPSVVLILWYLQAVAACHRDRYYSPVIYIEGLRNMDALSP